jgi:hypothetical protein
MVPTNPHCTRVLVYYPFSLSVIHNEGQCLNSEGGINRLMMMMTLSLQTQFHKSMPTVIFGIMCIISSFLVVMLPETKNVRLPDTIEEAEELSRKSEKNGRAF